MCVQCVRLHWNVKRQYGKPHKKCTTKSIIINELHFLFNFHFHRLDAMSDHSQYALRGEKKSIFLLLFCFFSFSEIIRSLSVNAFQLQSVFCSIFPSLSLSLFMRLIAQYLYKYYSSIICDVFWLLFHNLMLWQHFYSVSDSNK